METSDTDGGMETVATREWVIREVDGDGVLVEQIPDGDHARLVRSLLPDDVAEGDRFRVVAQVDRRGRRDGKDAPEADASVRGGEEAAGSADDAGTDAPADGPGRSGAEVEDGAAPAEDPGRSGAGAEDADDAPFEVPAAMEEALRNLS